MEARNQWDNSFNCKVITMTTINKASRSYFLGQSKLAKAALEDCDCCVLGFLDRCVL